MHMQNYSFFVTKEIYTLGKESAILALIFVDDVQSTFQNFLASFISYLAGQLIPVLFIVDEKDTERIFEFERSIARSIIPRTLFRSAALAIAFAYL